MDTVLFVDPITKRVAAMPVQMIAAYVPYASDLNLEKAAHVAAIRDDEAATNLLLSVIAVDSPEVLETFEHIIEGTSHDRLTVEPPSLR